MYLLLGRKTHYLSETSVIEQFRNILFFAYKNCPNNLYCLVSQTIYYLSFFLKQFLHRLQIVFCRFVQVSQFQSLIDSF